MFSTWKLVRNFIEPSMLFWGKYSLFWSCVRGYDLFLVKLQCFISNMPHKCLFTFDGVVFWIKVAPWSPSAVCQWWRLKSTATVVSIRKDISPCLLSNKTWQFSVLGRVVTMSWPCTRTDVECSENCTWYEQQTCQKPAVPVTKQNTIPWNVILPQFCGWMIKNGTACPQDAVAGPSLGTFEFRLSHLFFGIFQLGTYGRHNIVVIYHSGTVTGGAVPCVCLIVTVW